MKNFLRITVIFILLFSGCKNDRNSVNNLGIMDTKISQKDVTNLSGEKIYFGHQSVGYNIINGIKLIANENNTKLDIIEGLPGKDSKPGFYHTTIGKNLDPLYKIDDFVAKMESGVAQHVDIAFFKFCYVDFSYSTDIDQVFEHYKESMIKLKTEFPNTKFIYCTAPLVAESSKIKSLLRFLLGRKSSDKLDNIQRNKFNQLIHNEFDNKELVFDIAKFESNNDRVFFLNGSNKIFTLYSGFTSDGGHLNTTGSKIVASGLLNLLVNSK